MFDQDLDYSQEHRWHQAFEELGLVAAHMALDGTLLSVNHRLCELSGYDETYLLGRNFREILQGWDTQPECEVFLHRLIAGEIDDYSTDLYVQRGDGKVVWFNTVFSMFGVKAGNRRRSLTLVAQDVSPLRLARQKLRDSELARHHLSSRMIDGQEADRTRIARELHDDVGQSLAILKIQMLRAGQPVSGDAKRTHADLKELTGKLDTIIQRVNRLSHGLHSSELEFIGLAAALKNHCRECSDQLGIQIQCHCDEIEKTLNSLVGLAFLRVTQEALQNAAKHSRATSIIVRLVGSETDLSLEIADDGVGFNLEAIRLTAGLGLISMRERIHLIGGEFDIFSSPGLGTRIRVRVPFRPEL
jgi:PAS domain S-box-containing protein